MATPEQLQALLSKHGFEHEGEHFKGSMRQFNALIEDCQLPPQWVMPKEQPRVSPEAQRAYEERVKVREEALRLLCLIAVEFNSDPMSVQCFDLDTVKRTQYIAALINSGYA